MTVAIVAATAACRRILNTGPRSSHDSCLPSNSVGVRLLCPLRRGVPVRPLRSKSRWLSGVGLALIVAGSVLFARAPDPPISEADLLKGDQHMKGFGYDVMTPAGSAAPAQYGAIRRVYFTGKPDAPPILLLHELPGLRDADIDLGARLGKHFRVAAPLMFGVPGQNDTGPGKRQACASGLFDCKSSRASHRIVTDLHPLVQQICA